METLIFLVSAQTLFLIYLLIQLRNLKSLIGKTQKKILLKVQENRILAHNIYILLERIAKERLLPFPLMDLPLADKTGLVVSVKNIKIPSASSTYNASIGISNRGYVLFFRVDTPDFRQNQSLLSSRIGCTHLDANFEPLEEEFSLIETNSSFSEDARFFQHEGKPFLVYNEPISQVTDQRGIRIGALDPKCQKLEYVTSLDIRSGKVEKNWTPFSYLGKIHFLHTLNPQKILALSDPKKNLLQTLPFSFAFENWPQKWGSLRGGTPAALVEGEYLSFFHSSFEDEKGIIWYVMGAYTFAPSPPFEITRISPHPILFKGLYDMPHQPQTNPRVRAIYPAGFICDQQGGKKLIHVSCGENDSGIKIISIDQEILLKNLKNVFKK